MRSPWRRGVQRMAVWGRSSGFVLTGDGRSRDFIWEFGADLVDGGDAVLRESTRMGDSGRQIFLLFDRGFCWADFASHVCGE